MAIKPHYHIPLVMMRGHRDLQEDETLLDDWAWTNPRYTLVFPSVGPIESVVLDPNRLAADVDRSNNTASFEGNLLQEFNRK